MECEEEIKSIKTALRSIAMGGESSRNHLEVSVHKVKVAEAGAGDADDAPATFKIHLSSPIEERTITKLYDPLDPTAEGSLGKFDAIETSNALITVEAFSSGDSPRKLGESAPHDLLPLCQDVELWRKGGEKKSSTLEIAVVAGKGMDNVDAESTERDGKEEAPVMKAGDGEEDVEYVGEVKEREDSSEEWEDAVAEEVTDEGETEDSTKEEGAPEIDEAKDEKEETSTTDDAEEPDEPAAQDDGKSAELQLPAYTLTIQLEYTPSADDRRDALYDKLNEVSKRKVAAIESLRRNAGIVNRAAAAEAPARSGGGGKNPAVKTGFLNKPKAKEEKPPPFWKRWYGKTLGPNSLLWRVGPVAKNYVIFAGVSLFIHFKGDLLALPPPV